MRRRRRARFAVLGVAAISAASMFMLVAFHVFAVQSAFQLNKLQNQLAAEQVEYGVRRAQVDAAASPATVASEAAQLGMVRSMNTEVLHALGFRGPARPPACPYPPRPRMARSMPPTPARKRAPVARPRPSFQRRPFPRRRPKRVEAHPARRLAVCGVAVLVVFGALVLRVTQLQVLSGNRYRLASLRQTVHYLTIPAQRGAILDRDGRDLAMSIELSSVYVDPQNSFVDPIAYAHELAPVLHERESFLREQIGDRHYQFRYLAHDVDQSVVDKVRKLELQGVGFAPESEREYPAGTLAASIVGQLGSGPGQGETGLEYLYDGLLKGKAGKLVVETDQQGLDIPNTATHQVEAQRGDDVELTLDEPLQWETEQSLIDEVTATHAQGGMAVVEDVTNGDVLAMASIDGASGTTPADVSGRTEATRPLMDLFEPGSTNKLITLSTAIQAGLVQPDTVIDVPSALMVGGTKFTDVDVHGDVKMTVAQILGQSSNIGTIKIAQQLTNDQLAGSLREFGLGSPTTVDFPGQAAGLLLDPSHYYSTGLASTAIGYGVAVTGMQMLDAYVTIANSGVTRPPHLLDATFDAHGNRHAAPVLPGRRVVSTSTAEAMSSMLEGVVSSGTGACAAIPGYTVAGKTGTARKAVNGGYSNGTMASFIGYAPAAHPKLAAIVVLDQPSNTYGGTAAAPVFADVMQFALTHYGVAPDDVANTQLDAARASARESGTTCVDPAVVAATQVHTVAASSKKATKSKATKSKATKSKASSSNGGSAKTASAKTGQTAASPANGNVKPAGQPQRGATGTGGAPATPGSLPDDTSKSG